jgi:hypothetical protein
MTSQATCRPLRLPVVPPSPPSSCSWASSCWSPSRLPAAWLVVAVGGTPFALTLIGGALHVLNGDAPLGACALYLPEVHPELLGLLLGCPRSVGLLLLSLLLLLTAGGLLGLLERLVYVLCQPEVLSRLIE